MKTLLFALVVAAGCKASDKPAAGAPQAAPTTAAAWSKRATADCPAYPGKATVAIADVDGGYTVAIATTDAGAVKDIRDHARYVAGAAAAGAGEDALRHGGATGDRTRNCPVVLDRTTITAEDRPDGAFLTIKATDPAAVATLRQTARARAETLQIMRDAMK